MRLHPWLTLVFSSLLALAAHGAPVHRLHVAPATVDRAGVVVEFALPADLPRNTGARGAADLLPLQGAADGTARLVLATIKAGDAPVFTLEPLATLPLSGAVRADVTADRVRLLVEGAPFFEYWMAPEPLPNATVDAKFSRSSFIHPLRTPAGRILSASYPPDHLHHHGIWAPWTKTRFQGRAPDFWNMGDRTGTVEFAGLDRVWSGPVHGGFVSRHRFIDLSAPTPVTALHETWEVTVYAVPGTPQPVRLFDLVITQTCATSDPLVLPEYRYGGLGFRGHNQWLGAEHARFLTSEGLTDRVQAHGTRARWCHVGGEVDGQPAGLGILGHPGNFRAPQPMRIHPTEPFFCFAPSQLGDWQISPGTPYVARYRFVVTDGPPDAALLEACWQGYAQPGVATFD